ncbi:MAG: DNA polymerase III subunit chi [Hydrogenophilales bacterium CG03_land_8_20_14_0_80_62_28]|nr:MAG: DNA polymerase III subunit chi [Hydrogenophilales bacterium CG03_land_8_20_14_0_80_62_28]PIX01217.1 MAG: DNA polymerase III subunit chi [Hydrogenophilales bacterium CG_4_8_14_3_um_filter_62_83]PIY97458.1 MAG: DNA polymerase III subunit chi [Hydrogenophilales bacterium CG_4_10_14_0_8_um_filter_62_70]
MTRIDFYFNADDKADVARKLAAKVYQAGKRALLYVADARAASDLDAAIWTRDKLSFVPHVRCGHPLAKETPILIGADADALASPDVLVNLVAERPPFFSRFERLIELVSRDPADREAARQRYRFYRERGYEITNVDLDQHG